MLTKLTLLLAAASANIGQTLTGSGTSITGYGKYVTLAAAADAITFSAKPYACLRQGYTYAYPMTYTTASGANQPATVATTSSSTVRAFFGSTLATIGSGAGNAAG